MCKKRFYLLYVALMILIMLAGCGSPKQSATQTDSLAVTEEIADNLEKSQTQSESLSVTSDRAGNPITVPDSIDRIISLSPSATQTLVHLGLADKLVAVDNYSLYIDGLLENITSVDMLSPDVEMLIDLNADLVICSSMTNYDGSTPLKAMTDSGTCVAAIPSSNSIDGIRKDIAFIAQLVGRDERGEEIIADLDTGIEEIKKAVSGKSPKSVYFEIAAAPEAYSFGAGTFMNEMIEIAGGVNIFADTNDYIAVSEEQVIVRNPDVIFTNVTYIDDPVGEILGRDSLSLVTAVSEKQVYFIDANYSSQPNENILKAISEMAHYLHPDLWTND